jgi:type VI secretion system protein VasI
MAGLWYSDREDVTSRIDTRKAQSQGGYEGNSHNWMFHPSAIAFTRELMGAKQLYVRTQPINEGFIEMTFEVSGLSNAIQPLQKACHWH